MGVFSFLTGSLASCPPSSLTLPTPLTTLMSILIHRPEQVTSLLPRALHGLPPGVWGTHTHSAPAVESCSPVPQHALDSCTSACAGYVLSQNALCHFIWRDLACPSMSTCVTSSGRLFSACKQSWWALPSDSKTLCSVPRQGPEAEQPW